MIMIQTTKKAYSHKFDSIHIKIKTMNGISYLISTNLNASIASLQSQIQQKSNVPISQQRLLYKAILLQPLKYLSQYGINDNDTILLVANMLPQQISSPSISTHRQSQVIRTNTLTQQNYKTKKHRYLQQRINGFTYKYQQSIQTIHQNKIVIERLLTSLNNKQKLKNKYKQKQKYKFTSKQPFILQNKQLCVGDWIDVKDVSGLWVQGQIVGKKHNYVQIHCNGYPDRYNQWIEQSSQRIMPLRTQTVQSQDCAYLSPFPINKPQIKSVKYPQNELDKILTQLPQTLRNIAYLFDQLQDEQNNNKYKYNYNRYNENDKKQLNHPQFKYSFNQQQQQLQQDIAQSFKNNRSHHSPPASIHQQQYQYQDYQGEIVKLPIQKGTEIKQKQSSSIKGMIKLKNGRKQLMRSNRYIESKSTFLGYSKTKSQHQHSLNRQQTPQKMQINQQNIITININKNINININKSQNQNYNQNESEIDKKQTSVAMNLQDDRSQKQFIIINKKIQIQPQNQPLPYIQPQIQQEQQVLTPKAQKQQINQTLQQTGNQFEMIITESATKNQQSQSHLQSQTQKQQNISNKGQHDDGESSAKSFGSKRSDRFLDASSMKSLNIDTLHTHNENIKQQKSSHNKKNIFVFDQSQAQSVKQVQNKQNNQKGLERSNYYYNQQGILQQQDSQINQQANQQYFMQKKKQMLRKLRATQLAPICDRLGRMLIDLAPHLAALGYQDYNQNINNSNNYNQNLSTFTNQGSLQSRFKNFNNNNNNQDKQQDIQQKSYKSNKYWSFQIPVMLTPWEIMKLNKLLAEERGENQ